MRHKRMMVTGLASVVVLAGCGSSDTGSATGNNTITTESSSSAEQDSADNKVSDELLHVTQAGYGHTDDSTDDTSYAWVTAVVENTSADKNVVGSVRFTLYGSDGQVLDADDAGLIIRAGQKMATATQLSIPAGTQIDHMTTQPSVKDSGKESHPESSFEITGEYYIDDPYFPSVAGKITSHYQNDVSDIEIQAVCTDKKGDVVGGGSGRLDSLAGGASTGVTTDHLIVSETPAECQMFAGLTLASLYAAQSN